jgi:hypothetical protein
MGCPKLLEGWVFLRGGEKHLLFPRKPREKNRSRSAPAEMDGGWNLYAMVGNDPVGRWDWRRTEESGKKGCQSCKCCCVEKLQVRREPEEPMWDYKENTFSSGSIFHIDVTQRLMDSGGDIIEKPECSFKWEEKSNLPLNGGYTWADVGHWKDRTETAKGKFDVNGKYKVVENWGPLEEGFPVKDAFVDKSKWVFGIDKNDNIIYRRGKFIWVLYIKVTLYSSKDPKCRSVCSEKSKRVAMVQVMRWNKGMETPRIGYGYVF